MRNLSRHVPRMCRRRPEEVNAPGRVTASDAIMEEMCRAGDWAQQAAAAPAAAQSAALSVAPSAAPSAGPSMAQSAAPSAVLSAVPSAAPPTPQLPRHVERPRQILRKAGDYMHQAVRKSLGRAR